MTYTAQILNNLTNDVVDNSTIEDCSSINMALWRMEQHARRMDLVSGDYQVVVFDAKDFIVNKDTYISVNSDQEFNMYKSNSVKTVCQAEPVETVCQAEPVETVCQAEPVETVCQADLVYDAVCAIQHNIDILKKVFNPTQVQMLALVKFQNMYDELLLVLLNTQHKMASLPQQNKSTTTNPIEEILIDDLPCNTATNTGIETVPAKSIIGARVAIIYNVEYKRVAVFYADNEHGLNIKNGSISGFNKDCSYTRSISKPIDFFKINSGRALDAIEQLKCKKQRWIAKLNSNTIVIEVH